MNNTFCRLKFNFHLSRVAVKFPWIFFTFVIFNVTMKLFS